ncbi:MAG: serine hydrolase [Chloroflexota bacterium]
MKRLNGRFAPLVLLILLLSACSTLVFETEPANESTISRQTSENQPIVRPGRDEGTPSPEEQLVETDESTDNELINVVEAIENGDYGNVDSLLVWKDGALHVDAYFGNSRADQRHAIFSVTKSITSAAVGIAIAEGHIRSVEAPLAELLPDYAELDKADKQAITLEDVLTMRTGLEWDESSVIYGQPGNDASDMFRSTDWVSFVLQRKLADPPGTAFLYNSGNTVLLSAVLQEATGETTETYVAEKIFAPLEITDWQWEKTRGGLSNTGWGLHLLPQDMLKLGILFLQNGQWNDQQVIPADWVATSTAGHLTAGETTNYGYQWWRFQEDSHWLEALPDKNIFFAWGFGGNFIWVAPEENAVIVATGENFSDSTQIFAALETAVFPWLANSP